MTLAKRRLEKTIFDIGTLFSVAHTINRTFVCFKDVLCHTAHSSLTTTIIFPPCVWFKFPTHFMVTLNKPIICLPISKTDFDPTNSFPWKPKGDSIKAASNLRWVVKKESAGIN